MGEKGRENIPKTGENPKKKKNEKELGLVVSQETVIRNQAELSLLSRGKERESEKEKKRKRIRPNGPKIRNLQVEIPLSPNFGAERTLIDPISVTSKFHIFDAFLGLKLISGRDI